MTKVAVFGNGESRRSLDINSFRNDHIIIGCNAIHRDFQVDHLVCCDRKMAEEATDNLETKSSLIYVREEHYHYFRKVRKNKHIRLLPDLPYTGERRADIHTHWGSGAYAVLIGCLLSPEEMHLFGFDLYGNDGLVNNVYKGTDNYKGINGSAVDPSYWIYHISKLFSCFPNIEFKIHNDKNWKMPLQWQQKNVEKLETTCSVHKYLV